MYLKPFLCLLLCGGYGGALWAAKKRQPAAEAVLSFFDGIYLALLCLFLLPCALSAAFYPAALAAGCGIGVWFFLERRMGRSLLCAPLFTILFGIAWLSPGQIMGRAAIGIAFLGGMGLYQACAGILPEGVRPAEHIGGALLSGAGFLLGTLACVLF